MNKPRDVYLARDGSTTIDISPEHAEVTIGGEPIHGWQSIRFIRDASNPWEVAEEKRQRKAAKRVRDRDRMKR